jgi:hypothetical protein
MATKRSHPPKEAPVKDEPDKNKVGLITGRGRGIVFALICLFIFGWIAVVVAMNNRTNEVLRGQISRTVGLRIIKNYLIGLWATLGTILAVMFVAVANTPSSDGEGYLAFAIHLPQIIALVAVLAVYLSCKNKINNYNPAEDQFRESEQVYQSAAQPKTPNSKQPNQKKWSKFISIEWSD